jgi:hypothetical protein
MTNYKLQHALHKSFTLLIAVLLMVVICSFNHLPYFNVQIVVFAFLASSVLFEVKENLERLRLLLKIYLSTSILQILMGISHNYLFAELILITCASAMILSWVDNRSAVMVIFINSYLNYFDNANFNVAISRVIELSISSFVAYLSSYIGHIFLPFPSKNITPQLYSKNEKISIICEILTAILLANLFSLKQGIWVILTIFFIRLAIDETHTIEKLSARRILSVPLGLWFGIIFISSLTYLNYRFFYLVPFLGVCGFFTLYYYGNFFFFSLFFMFTFMIYTDYSVGVYNEFHPWQLLLGRSLATLYGALIVIIFTRIIKIGEGRNV